MFAVIFYVNLEIYQLLAQTDVDSMWTNMDLCGMVQIRAEWCRSVQNGAESVRNGAESMRNGAESVLVHAESMESAQNTRGSVNY